MSSPCRQAVQLLRHSNPGRALSPTGVQLGHHKCIVAVLDMLIVRIGDPGQPIGGIVAEAGGLAVAVDHSGTIAVGVVAELLGAPERVGAADQAAAAVVGVLAAVRVGVDCTRHQAARVVGVVGFSSERIRNCGQAAERVVHIIGGVAVGVRRLLHTTKRVVGESYVEPRLPLSASTTLMRRLAPS